MSESPPTVSEVAASDLTASASRSTELDDGLAILDANGNAMDAAGRGEWAEAGLNLGLAGLDTLGAVFDPFGALLSSGVAWLIEHVDFLREPFDAVAGDPGRISAMAATWANVSQRLGETAEIYAGYVSQDLATLSGSAVAGYRTYSGKESALLHGLARSVRGTGEALQTAGAVVGAVRGVVRDLISAAVSKAISAGIQFLASGGTATPWLVAQVSSMASRTMATIADWLRRLVDAVGHLSTLLQSARGQFDELVDVLRAVRRWGDETGVAQSAVFNDGLDARPGVVLGDSKQFGLHATWSTAKNSATNAETADEPLRQD